jgi:hypothetical protein
MPKKKGNLDVYGAIQFSERLSDTGLWIEKAEELLAAAEILEVEVRKYWKGILFEATGLIDAPSRRLLQGPYFLLMAYALENYFKALLVHRNKESFRNRLLFKIPNYINQHDLLRLANKVGMKLSVPEEKLLFRLSNNSIWAARYPVPIDPNGIITTHKFSDGKWHLTAYLGPKDIDLIHQVIERCREVVKREIGVLNTKALPPQE